MIKNQKANISALLLNKKQVRNDTDSSLYDILSKMDINDIAFDLKQVLQGCTRTNPFTNVNVVATTTMVSFLAIQLLKANEHDYFNVYKSKVVNFAIDKLSWPDFVKAYWSMQQLLDISNEFSDEVITSLELEAVSIMQQIPNVPGDITPLSVLKIPGLF